MSSQSTAAAKPRTDVAPEADECGCGHDHGHHGHHHHHHGHHHGHSGTTLVRQGPKVGRNDPCPCGSGRKHKKCCLAA